MESGTRRVIPNSGGSDCLLHRRIKRHEPDLPQAILAKGYWRDRERPILINNWEATYFDFNEDSIAEITKTARKAGSLAFLLGRNIVSFHIFDGGGQFRNCLPPLTSINDIFKSSKHTTLSINFFLRHDLNYTVPF